METQDVKVGKINDLKGAALIDQTALMLLLQRLSTQIDEQTTQSKDNGDRLEKIEGLISQMLKELVAIKEIMDSSKSTENAGISNGGA